MKTSKTISLFAVTFAFAFAVGLFTIPAVDASAGTVENYFWQNNPGMCYKTSSLDNMNVDGTTGQGSTVETEFEKARTLFNNNMDNITINADSSANCSATYRIEVSSDDMASGVMGSELSSWGSDATVMTKSVIKFNTDMSWKVGTGGCSTSDADIKYIANHELGHGTGLKHHGAHAHGSVNSMMHKTCNDKLNTLQSVDKTALDLKY
jgi:hypothetical protein